MGILATISFGSYRTMKADSEAKTCETKLVALQAAFSSCVMEKGVATCVSGNPPFLTEIAQGNLRQISCPADTNSPDKGAGGTSYGYNAILSGLNKTAYENIPEDLIIIGDFNADSFSTLDRFGTHLLPLIKRHTKYGPLTSTKFAIAITKSYRYDKGKLIKRIDASNEACHADYQKCLTNWFNGDRSTSPYASCTPGSSCSSDYQ